MHRMLRLLPSHRFPTPAFLSLFGLMILASAYCIIWVAPPEAHQGYVQKIFYIHVGSALAMNASFCIGALGAVLYLWRRLAWADALAVAAIEVGVVFCTVVLVTGPIWARPVWGVWWTWDARLTSTLFAWLIFVSYLLVRHALTNPEKARLVSAAVAIFGVLDIPIIVFAVTLWRGVHPTVLRTEGALPASMALTLALAMTTIVVGALLLIRVRYQCEVRHA